MKYCPRSHFVPRYSCRSDLYVWGKLLIPEMLWFLAKTFEILDKKSMKKYQVELMY